METFFIMILCLQDYLQALWQRKVLGTFFTGESSQLFTKQWFPHQRVCVKRGNVCSDLFAHVLANTESKQILYPLLKLSTTINIVKW